MNTHRKTFQVQTASAKITCWIVKHWVQGDWIHTWCISVSCSPANDPACNELPWYLYLGHCFELCNTFIFLSTRLLSHAGTDPPVSMQQMQSVYTFSNVLGSCHREKTFLEPWPIGWWRKQSVLSSQRRSKVWNGVFISAQRLQQYSHMCDISVSLTRKISRDFTRLSLYMHIQ